MMSAALSTKRCARKIKIYQRHSNAVRGDIYGNVVYLYAYERFFQVSKYECGIRCACKVG